MQPNDYTPLDTVCLKCQQTFSLHRASDLACPAPFSLVGRVWDRIYPGSTHFVSANYRKNEAENQG